MATTYARTWFTVGTSTYAVSNRAYNSNWTSYDNGQTSANTGLILPTSITTRSTVNIVIQTNLTPGGQRNGGYIKFERQNAPATTPGSVQIYLCDNTGNNAVFIETITGSANLTNHNAPKTVNLRPLAGKRVYIKNVRSAEPPIFAIFGDIAIHVTYDTVDHPKVTAGNPIKNSEIASLRFYKGGPETGPGVGVKIEPFVIGTKNATITASEYNNA